MSIYDDPDITLDQISIELGYLLRDIAVTGLRSLNREYREFRKFQMEQDRKESPIDQDEWI